VVSNHLWALCVTGLTGRGHRSNRSEGWSCSHVELRMNKTRGSSPPNPTPDLLIHSTDSHKTLEVGTPHGHSIAKLWSTKTR
jgi:hypothetical protein